MARTTLAAATPLHEQAAIDAHGPTHLTRGDLRALVEGLDATAKRQLNDLPGQLTALTERRAVLAARQQQTPRDETLHELARLSHQQAWTAATLMRWDDARRFLTEGLAADAAWRTRTSTPLDPVSVSLVELCAEVFLRHPYASPLDRDALVTSLRNGLKTARSMKSQTAKTVRTRWPAWLTRLSTSS